MPLKKEDSEVTAFVVPWGQYEWAGRTPFGLKGAGYSFQRMMATVLSSSNFTEALCYLDDILIWGNTWGVHMDRLHSVLKKVSWAGLALNPTKCQFGVNEVTYLGSMIRNGMVSIGDQRVADLRSLPVPTTVRELRRVLGGFSFIQRWLPGIADVAKPLNAGVKGKPHSKLRWTVEMHNAFRRLKQLVAEATALKIPDHNKEFTLITDCSDKGAGAVLTQEENGTRIPVAYFHHTLTPAETRYTTTDKELLAVVLSIRKFRVYLTKRFNLITDHLAVRWLTGMNIHDERGRRGRWIEFLQNFDIQFIHRSGKSPELSMADYLSRVSHESIVDDKISQASMCKTSMEQVEEPPVRMGIDSIKREQRKHFPELLDVFKTDDAKSKAHKMVPGDTIDEKVLDRISIDSRGLMVMTFNGGRRKKSALFGVKEIKRIVIPPGIRKQAMEICHSAGLGGHMGIERTWQRVRNSFYWRGMKDDVAVFVRECEQCGVNKHSTHANVAPFQMTDIPNRVVEHLQLDFCGPFPAANTHPFRYALQIQDVLTRFVMFVPCINDSAETAATALMNQWVCLFGAPCTINTDRGTHFTAEVFQALCRVAEIDHKLGAPKHPESQGKVERQNQLIAQVRCISENNVEKWPEALYRVTLIHNASQSETTKLAPLRILLSQEPRTPEVAWIRDQSSSRELATSRGEDGHYMEALLQDKERELARMIKEAKEQTRNAQLRRMEGQIARRTGYKVGDLVRIKLDSNEIKKRGKKMAKVYSERYMVYEVIGGGWTYKLRPHERRGRNKIRHFNDLKDANIRRTEMESGDEEVLYEIERTTPPSGHEDRKQKLTQKRGNSKNQKTDNPKNGESEESRCQNDKEETTLRRSTRKRSTTKRLQLNVVPGKRYAEKDVEIIPEEEDSESESDRSFVTVGENSFVEMSTEGDESDLSSSEGN